MAEWDPVATWLRDYGSISLHTFDRGVGDCWEPERRFLPYPDMLTWAEHVCGVFSALIGTVYVHTMTVLQLEVNKRLRTWFFPAGTEPEFGENPDPDLWGVPNSFFTLNERWCAPRPEW